MSNREIITLQLGNYSNYVGAHWWNIQESTFSYDPNAPAGDIDHDTLFREGRNQRGEITYTPRLLLVDLKGTLKHLPRSGGDLYATLSPIPDDVDDSVCWDADGQLDVVRDEPADKSAYQQELDATVQSLSNASTGERSSKPAPDEGAAKAPASLSATVDSWTDFMYGRYHPRSINIVDQFVHSEHEADLDTFAAGALLWRTEQFEDGDFGDRIRQYIEECNSCQGFQMLFDGADGFAGLASRCLEHVRDEYGKTVLAVPLFEGRMRDFKLADSAMSDSIRVVNVAMAYANALTSEDGGAALMLPLSASRNVWRTRSGRRELPLFDYTLGNHYETSAVLATYMDTITQEYRLKGAPNGMAGFCSSLNNYGRRLAVAGLALPFRIDVGQQLIERLDGLDIDGLFTPLSPNSQALGTERCVQHVSIRGLSEQRLKRPLERAGEQIRMAAYACASSAEMLQLYFQCSMYASLTHVRCSERGMPVRRPFPVELFDERVRTPNGNWQEWAQEASVPPETVPVMACAQTNCDIANTIESLHREAKRIRLAKLPRFAAAGLEADEYAEALERLAEFQDNYDDAFEL